MNSVIVFPRDGNIVRINKTLFNGDPLGLTNGEPWSTIWELLGQMYGIYEKLKHGNGWQSMKTRNWGMLDVFLCKSKEIPLTPNTGHILIFINNQHPTLLSICRPVFSVCLILSLKWIRLLSLHPLHLSGIKCYFSLTVSSFQHHQWLHMLHTVWAHAREYVSACALSFEGSYQDLDMLWKLGV